MIRKEQLSEDDLRVIRRKLVITILLVVVLFLLTGVHK
jgi:hypothetical protein